MAGVEIPNGMLPGVPNPGGEGRILAAPNLGGGAEMIAAAAPPIARMLAPPAPEVGVVEGVLAPPARAQNLGGGARMLAAAAAAAAAPPIGRVGVLAPPAGARNLGGGAWMNAVRLGQGPAQEMFDVEGALEGPPLRRSEVGPFFFFF
ncbi:hypothetical protein M758_3G210000 [Ceratodon purpureus]|nr:hypothetical protein M758_3G210000 [Ceratodon purpureus]